MTTTADLLRGVGVISTDTKSQLARLAEIAGITLSVAPSSTSATPTEVSSVGAAEFTEDELETITELIKPVVTYAKGKAATLAPRPYQVDCIQRLLREKRLIVADKAGLGKTLEATEAMQLPVLIAVPSYLLWQWYDHVAKEYPKLTISMAYGSRAQRELALAKPADVYLVNLDMLRPYDMKESGKITGYVMPKGIKTFIADEAHHLRGRDTKRTQGARWMARQAEYVFLLTATPMYKDVTDIYSLLNLLDPREFNSFYRFVEDNVITDGSVYGVHALKAKRRFKQDVYPKYVLERSYSDVGEQLPRQITNSIAVRASPEFMAEYHAVRATFIYNEKDVNSLMEAMQIMRRMTSQPKLEAALEILQDDPQGIIYTWYRDTAEVLAGLLKCPFIHGGIDAKLRGTIAKECKLVVASMSSLSEGADLSHLNHVIFFEGDYVPSRIYQALSRVRRLRAGSEPVRVTYIYVAGTIDERVYNAAKQRNASIQSVMREELLGDMESAAAKAS